MSIVNFLGCNFKFPIHDDHRDIKIMIGECFTDPETRKVAKRHFSTKYIYEVFTDEYVGIWFNENYRNEYPKSNSESQESFIALCKLLDRYLEDGEYCELYTCWAGEENGDRNMELDQTINLHNFDINKIEIYEKTLLVIKK